MFNNLVVVEPLNINKEELKDLYKYSKNVVIYDKVPKDDLEIIERIKDSDAVLVSYTTKLNKNVLMKTLNLKYIGMCCSLYSKESANVDIAYCEEHGIVVKGVRDYGDNGVIEYIIHELVGLIGLYTDMKYDDIPHEISSLKCSVIGLGTSGTMIAKTLLHFGADVSYYSRTRKKESEDLGIKYKPLNELLKESDAIFMALNKNVILLNQEEFNLTKKRCILFNTSIGPGFDSQALKNWLKESDTHYFFGDTLATSGDDSIWLLKNAKTINRSSGGKTYEAFKRLKEKSFKNIEDFLNENNLD